MRPCGERGPISEHSPALPLLPMLRSIRRPCGGAHRRPARVCARMSHNTPTLRHPCDLAGQVDVSLRLRHWPSTPRNKSRARGSPLPPRVGHPSPPRRRKNVRGNPPRRTPAKSQEEEGRRRATLPKTCRATQLSSILVAKRSPATRRVCLGARLAPAPAADRNRSALSPTSEEDASEGPAAAMPLEAAGGHVQGPWPPLWSGGASCSNRPCVPARTSLLGRRDITTCQGAKRGLHFEVFTSRRTC